MKTKKKELDTYYFRHDVGSIGDRKIQNAILDMGAESYAIFWVAVEILYENGGYCPKSDYRMISMRLMIDLPKVKKLIEEYDLFDFDDDDNWYSQRVLEELKIRKGKSEQAIKAVNTRWNKEKSKGEEFPVVDFDDIDSEERSYKEGFSSLNIEQVVELYNFLKEDIETYPEYYDIKNNNQTS